MMDGFYERNRILEEDFGMVPVTSPEDYFRVLFTRPDSLGREVNYLQATGPENWGDRHFNAVAYNLIPVKVKDRKTGELVDKERARKYDITRSFEECRFLSSADMVKVISSPILYAGRSRKSDRARSIWGIGVDLDDVSVDNLRTLMRFIDKLNYTPMPSMMVSSGNGLHLYYLFPTGLSTKSTTVKALQRLKHNMTKDLWNGLFSSNPQADVHQGIWQGFRIPGTPAKDEERTVVGFVPEKVPYYTVRELNEWFRPALSELIERDNKPLTEAELSAIEHDRYLPSEISFEEARRKWPEWKPGKASQWVSNRKLYDWWLNVVIRGGEARKKDFKGDIPLASGRRFYWMQSLVVFAKKCAVPYDEVRADAYSLLPMFDALTVKEDNHFTARDIENALEFYRYSGRKSAARFKRNHIGARTHYYFRKNKRNGLSREENLIIARTARDVKFRKRGIRWDAHNGPKTAKLKVEMWCLDHPFNSSKTDCARDLGITVNTVSRWWFRESPGSVAESVLLWRRAHQGVENKSLCARECGIDPKTVRKWWDCTEEDVAAECERLSLGRRKGMEASGIIRPRTEKAPTPVFDVDAFLLSEGVPEYLIPVMKANMKGFWEQYRKAHPDTSLWTEEVRRAYEAGVS